ncbi:hypothetical protein H0H92_001036 [Tricholoma furcatifolium]|nr:hypothetical protein H0H92_001036 [Tricholoma furcatifolium]
MGDTDSDSSDGDGDEEKVIEGAGNRIQIPLSKSHSKETEEAMLREDADGAQEEHEFGILGQKVTRSRFKLSTAGSAARATGSGGMKHTPAGRHCDPDVDIESGVDVSRGCGAE